MNPIAWMIFGFVLLLLFIVYMIMMGSPSALKRREDAEADWRVVCCSADTVDKLLDVACEAFMFSPKMTTKLRPEDTIIGLYRIIYPRKSYVDQMEIETFLIPLDEDLGLKYENIDWDMSLAEIAERIESEKQPTSCT